jgi:hypothetical protein
MVRAAGQTVSGIVMPMTLRRPGRYRDPLRFH